ncbi:hypothetical protein MTAB308_5479, partial [Mycobacterium terramassiliense]
VSGTRWPTKSLGDLFVVGAGKAMSAASRIGENKVPFLRTSNVFWDEINLAQVDEMAIPDRELADKLVERGDLLVCEGGEIGRAAIWEGGPAPMSFQNHLHRLRPRAADVDPRFYVYFLQSAFTQLGIFEGAGNKTTIPNLSSGRLKALEVPHPPLAEQGAIADVLRYVQRARRINKRVLSTTRELKSAAMEQLFTRGLRGEAQKETDIGQIPESWELVPLGELGRIGNGSTPKRSTRAYWDGGTFPWLNSAKVYDRDIRDADQFVTDVALKECHLPVLEPGAVLVAITGQGKTLGNAAVLSIRATINQHLAYLQTDLEKAEPKFVRAYLETQYAQLRAVASGGGSTKGALTCGFLRGMTVPWPPTIVEQQEIVEVLDVLDRKIELLGRKRDVLDQLFKSLLHKLMTGGISVDDVDLSALPSVDGTAA